MTEEIIELLKMKRKELSLTQEELADKAGVGLRFIREMEQGKETLASSEWRIGENEADFCRTLGQLYFKTAWRALQRAS